MAAVDVDLDPSALATLDALPPSGDPSKDMGWVQRDTRERPGACAGDREARPMTDPLDRVVSIHDIQQLAYRYAATADRGDAQGFASLFAETEAPKPDPYVDIHAVRQRIAHGLTAAGREQMLFVGNHLIDFDRDDEAHGTVYCLAQIQFGDDFVDQSIVYEDRYVRLDGRWLFLNRRHLLWYGATRSPNPLRQRPADWPRGQVGYGVATAERRASPA